MFIVTPYPNIAYALDLTKPGAPIKWTYEPHPDADRDRQGLLRRGQPRPDLRRRQAGLHACSTARRWRSTRPPASSPGATRLGDPANGMTITMSPLVVGKTVLVGNSGGEMGVRGQLTALDLDTGKELWRAYSTGPDADVKIGADFRAPYPWLSGKDLGLSTWPAGRLAARRRHGLGLDLLRSGAEPDLLRHQQPQPARAGAAARRQPLVAAPSSPAIPPTGAAQWAFQFTPHDQWDYDGVNENILIDGPIGGQIRASCWSISTATASATPWTAPPARILVAKPFGRRQLGHRHRSWPPAGPIVNPAKEAKVEREGRRHLPNPHRQQGLAALRPSRRAPA